MLVLWPFPSIPFLLCVAAKDMLSDIVRIHSVSDEYFPFHPYWVLPRFYKPPCIDAVNGEIRGRTWHSYFPTSLLWTYVELRLFYDHRVDC